MRYLLVKRLLENGVMFALAICLRICLIMLSPFYLLVKWLGEEK